MNPTGLKSAIKIALMLSIAAITNCSKPETTETRVYRAIDDKQVLRIRSADEVELTRDGTNFVSRFTRENDALRLTLTIMGTTQAVYYRFTPQGLRSDDGTILYAPAQYQAAMAQVNAARDQLRRNQELCNAAKRGDTGAIRSLLQDGAQIETPDERGLTPLLSATVEGHADAVAALLEKGANANVANRDGSTPLMFACNAGGQGNLNNRVSPSHDRIAKLLLERKAQLDRQQENGYTALMYGVFRNNVQLVRLLVRAGANRNLRDRNGKTALDYAQDPEMREALRTQKENEELNSFRTLPRDGTDLEIIAKPGVYSNPLNVDGVSYNFTYYGPIKIRVNRTREIRYEEGQNLGGDVSTLEFMSAGKENAKVSVRRR
jgi:hypothetical protein